MRSLAVLLIVLLVAAISSVPPSAAEAADCWSPPVRGVVIDPYRAPDCPWCAGNRGIEYRVSRRAPVRAVAAGEVTFSGIVVGVGYVTVRHADGRRSTYGRLVERSVRRGDRVVARTLIGRASDSFHFGLRAGERYVDPTPHLGRVEGRPRLIPADGTAARAAPPPTVRCGTRTASR